MTELYRDSLNIPFDEYTQWLNPSRTYWATPKPVKDAQAVSRWRQRFEGKPCWWCSGSTRGSFGAQVGELHHLHAAGGRKCDSPELFFWLCAGCHRIGGEAVKAESLGRLLWLKWRFDCENLVWDRLAIRLHRWLPDLVVDSPALTGRG